MAHYAILDDNNVVTQVITGRDENDNHAGVSDWEAYYSNVMGAPVRRTSYNTAGGVHFEGGTPFRYNHAGIGFAYDEERDAFIPPKPFESWVLDEATCLWVAPVAYPEDGNAYTWDEESVSWVVVPVDESGEAVE